MNKTKNTLIVGSNCVVANDVILGKNIQLGNNVVIEDSVELGDNVIIDTNTIIRSGTHLGTNSTIGANCIIGEHLMDWYERTPATCAHKLFIGGNAIIRSGTIIYTDSSIGSYFQTGHFTSVREKSIIGNHVSAGTLCNIQGYCTIGNYVRMHSNVQVGQATIIDDYVWIFPNVVFTNDPQPPSEDLAGSHICSFAVIATGALILPGITVNEDSLVAAGAVVTQDVEQYSVVRGNPAKHLIDVRYLRNQTTGKKAYPWRYHFNRGMPWEELGYEAWYASLGIEKK